MLTYDLSVDQVAQPVAVVMLCPHSSLCTWYADGVGTHGCHEMVTIQECEGCGVIISARKMRGDTGKG